MIVSVSANAGPRTPAADTQRMTRFHRTMEGNRSGSAVTIHKGGENHGA
jgi:hypothetical protein